MKKILLLSLLFLGTTSTNMLASGEISNSGYFSNSSVCFYEVTVTDPYGIVLIRYSEWLDEQTLESRLQELYAMYRDCDVYADLKKCL
ncbi:hypothetical protein [Myroides marinus]|uniref:hypothetical protein n=1 Tax=Myroides marinus TaxID=703342 RepID=UPI002575B05C|nr:hypothetical protein [Myroides marinus]MDM1380726.1 hypothetical protein [Myroides marinus]MDM1388017.1 hypothetical protein [Myroides marinus]MDM1395229.1 hypothetical protein [Myroides marinus]